MRVLVFAIFAAACSDVGNADSGVPGADLLVSLDSTQQQAVCNYAQSVEGGAHTVTCSNGSSVTAGVASVDDCAAALADLAQTAPDCTATVTDDMLCFQATADESNDQLCANYVPGDCQAVVTCLSSPSGPGSGSGSGSSNPTQTGGLSL